MVVGNNLHEAIADKCEKPVNADTNHQEQISLKKIAVVTDDIANSRAKVEKNRTQPSHVTRPKSDYYHCQSAEGTLHNPKTVKSATGALLG